MTAPVRQKRHDRLLHGSSPTQAEIRCDMATAPFDKVARDMDRKWGVDRLPELVSPATADRWGSAIAKMNAAIQSADPEETRARVEVCIRGMRAMDAEAEAAGHKPAAPDVWQIEIDGKLCALIRDDREWPAAEAARPGMEIITLRQAAVALAAYRNALPPIDNTPQPAPRERTALERELDDEIPF